MNDLHDMAVSPLWLTTTFLDVGRESYGLVPGARPIATRHLLVAADGFSAESGGVVPLYECPGEGVDKLAARLYPMLPQDATTIDIVRMTLGDGEGGVNHLISRLYAIMVEAEVFHTLYAGTEAEVACASLAEDIPEKLALLKTTLKNQKNPGSLPPYASASYDQVSFGACRVIPQDRPGVYHVEIFSAGDFGVYLLDGHGLSPLWTEQTEPVTSKGGTPVMLHRMTLTHPEPFALLLLSHGLCHVDMPRHGETQNEWQILRERMTLEERCLRIVEKAAGEDQFGAVAAQVFSPCIAGADALSGAMTLLLPTHQSYDVFHSACARRLQALHEMLTVIPEKDDPSYTTPQESLRQTERAYAAELFRTSPKLLDQTLEALNDRIPGILKEALHTPGMTDDAPEVINAPVSGIPADEDAISPPLTPAVVYAVYRRYDRENDPERAQIQKNRQILRRTFSGHWVTLRPALAEAAATWMPSTGDTYERAYSNCCDMNRRLDAILTQRRDLVARVKRLLSDSQDVLASSGNDWIVGRGSRELVAEWLDALTGEAPGDLPALLREIREDWPPETEGLRSLQSAYTGEREALFCADTEKTDGRFVEIFAHIYHGTMPDDVWDACRTYLTAQQGLNEYADMILALRVISTRNRELYTVIRERDAERKCLVALRSTQAWQFACLRAAVYHDPAWGDGMGAFLDEGTRNNYLKVVRTWQETQALRIRRAEIADGYRTMYQRYDRDD